jgi:formyltetrahydrofolate deformylase
MTSQDGLPTYLIKIACPNRIGIVADVSRFLVDHGCDITNSAQFDDPDGGRFFLRTAFASTTGASIDELRRDFAPIAERYGMEASFHDPRRKLRTLIMVSKFGHCLNDLLFRARIGALPIEIPAIASNHTDFADVAANAGIPFYHMPVTPQTKAAKEKQLSDLVDREGIELIVLARYMQVLSPDLCSRFLGRVINIHHSFLPSFIGARPYHRAYERGVKLIGATAHYVTPDLDEGPIIEQAVERVHHGLTAEDFVAVGRDVEALVLARAVKWHAEHRVLLNGERTIVFQ